MTDFAYSVLFVYFTLTALDSDVIFTMGIMGAIIMSFMMMMMMMMIEINIQCSDGFSPPVVIGF